MTLQPTPTSNGELARPTPAEMFVAHLAERLIRTGAYSPGSALLVQALNADTIEEAMRVGELLSGKDYSDQRIRFVNVLFTDSDPDLNARIPFYALCDVVLDDGTGEVRRMSVGAEQPLGVLIRAVEQGWLPFEGQFQTVKLDSVRTAINLVPVPARVASSQPF